MSKLLKSACNLCRLAKPAYRKYHTINKDTPTGTVNIGDNHYMDFGGVTHKKVGDRLVEVVFSYNNMVEIIVPVDEVNASGILGYHHPNLPDHE